MKDDIADDFEWSLKVTSGSVNTVIIRLKTAVHEVNYNGRTYCLLRPEGAVMTLCAPLGIAKFLAAEAPCSIDDI